MNLEQLIASYQPPENAIATIRQSKIALLVGITGAGKDTIKKVLIDSSGFRDIISHTTRQPRVNAGVPEVKGVHYHFIPEEEARTMLEQGEFVEAKFVHGTVYGTSIAAVKKASEAGVAITDLDVQGVAEYKAISSEVVAIFVVPPTYEAWLQRLKMRYATEAEFEAEWPKRRDSAVKELTQALLAPYYHFIVNDDLDQAAAAAVEIISHSTDEFHSKDDDARLVARQLLEEIRERS